MPSLPGLTRQSIVLKRDGCAPPAQSAVCAGHEPSRRRAEAGQAAALSAQPRRDPTAGRFAAAPAGERDRPPGAAEDSRGCSGNHGDAGSHRRSSPAAAAAQFPRALPRLCQRRHRRRGADVLPRQARLCRKAAAGRREAIRLRHAADVRRHSADRASRPRRRRSGICKTQRHRPGLSPYRGACAGFAPPGDRAGAAEAAGIARMDQPGSAAPLQLSADPRSAEPCACPGRTHGHFARWPVLVAARLRRTARRPTGAGAGARAVAAPGRRPPRRRRPSAPQHHRRAALCADGLAARGSCRHHRGSAPAGADVAPAAGRCRVRQDGGGAARRGRGRRGRQAGRADGAD